MNFSVIHIKDESVTIIQEMVDNFTDFSLRPQRTANGTDMLDLYVQLVGDYLIFVISTPLSIFGCIANVVSLIIFLRQGRKDCVTVCLFALGVSDFLCCFTVLVFSSLYSCNYINNFVIIEPLALDVVLSYISAMFYDISQGITAFISLQRCLCVAMPLTFKNLFTVSRSVAIVLAFYVLTTVAYTPHFRTCGIYMKLDEARNLSISALWESRDRAESIFWLNYLLHIGVDSFYQFVVVVSAIVMITGLKKSSRFRQKDLQLATINAALAYRTKEGLQHNNNKFEQKSNRSVKNPDNKTGSRRISDKNRNVVKTIFALSVLAIVCNTERLSVVYGQRFVQGLTFDGVYHIIFFVSARVTFLFSMINASLNVVVYYFLNPSYRRTFQQIFCGRQQRVLKPRN